MDLTSSLLSKSIFLKNPKISFPNHPCPNSGAGTARKFRENDKKQQNLLLRKLGSNQLWPLLPDTEIFLCFDFPTCKIKLFAKTRKSQFSGKILP